jgi:outer membrane receptor protein involved in Fe transport
MTPSQKLAFSYIFDKERQENLGVNSQTAEESGYSKSRGGPTYTLKESAIFKPTVLLESTLSWFDNSFAQTPTTNPDTNGNGILFVENRPELGGNRNGILEAVERDSGEDWDRDGFYDVYEDVNHDDQPSPGEDLDQDGDVSSFCEGYHHEDQNCNGTLDREEDTNLDGVLQPDEDAGIPCYDWGYCPGGKLPGTANNGKFDSEDKNGNGVLDVLQDSGYTVAPFWNDTNGNGYPDRGEYHAPLPPDRDLVRDSSGRTSGPGRIDQQDHRKRLSWIEDLSLFAADLAGTHDLRLGFAYEHEGYDNEVFWAPVFNLPSGGFFTNEPLPNLQRQVHETITVNMAIPAIAQNSATGDNLGIYFQDSWKPVPNLTLGLGLRYDYESIDSFGYTSFDPAAERHAFDSLMSVAAVDGDPFDGITATGFCRDPIHSCLGSEDPGLQVMKSQLLGLAFDQFTRHNLDVDVKSYFLQGITDGTSLSGVPGNGLKVRSPEDIQITNSNLAPRLSLSWDPWADGKTMVFSSWGRYYDKIFLNAVTLEQGPDTVSRTYLPDSNGYDFDGFPDHNLFIALAQSPLSAVQVDRSLATPYSDEWTAGFRRELAPEVLVSLRYVHRDYHNQLQDIDINHRTAIDPTTGALADRLGDPTCLQGQACQNVPNGAPDLYVNNIFLNRVLRLGNFNEQTYRGWEVEFVRRLKRKWQLEASYTYSVAQGDAESYLSEIGNDPALVEYEPGYLSYDQRHVVKLNAVAFLPGDWRLGGTITWASGLPYSARVYYRDLDDVGYYQNRIRYGQLGPRGYGITSEQRNNHRNNAAYLLNARVVKSFVIGKSSASAFLEVYNLLNSDTLTVSSIDQIPATFIYSGTGPPVQVPPTSEVVGERDFGRRFQIGFQVDF